MTETTDQPYPTEGIFEGRTAYAEALRATLIGLCEQGCREIYCIDASFVDWPWSDRAVIDALAQWARRGRMLHLLALQYDEARRRHPSFVQWRTTYDHCVDARQHEPEPEGNKAPAAACFGTREGAGAEPYRSLRLLNSELGRGVVSVQAGDRLRLEQWFDALAQRSEAAFPASTLGL
ncbi:MAG TPA: hypothetical protein VGM81_24065 [Burkholderiaceae bacterium]